MPGANFSFDMVYRLKITIGGNFVPSARQLSPTVIKDFSAPVVFTVIVFWPLKSTVLLGGRSNEMGVSSMFPMVARGVIVTFSLLFQDKAMDVLYFLLHTSGQFLGNVGFLS